jgi:hypothetical protein
MCYLKKRVFYSIVVLCFLFGASSMANAYKVYDCWTSHDGWGDPDSSFTTNSEAVYFNVRNSSWYSYIRNKWYRPNGTEEKDIGTNILAHWVYEKGLCVGFYTWMVIEGKDREPGEWRVEHWAQDVYDKWYLMCTNYFTITEAVSNPLFSPQPGTYTTPQTVTLSCATLSATTHYTTDGSSPTESSPVYSTPITIAETTTVKARAYKSGITPSDTVTGLYRIVRPMPWIPLLLDE